ncbi:hypothetical protein [Escherichia coli]|uniref:hypothetical protein n=1 Tax=Escherichia coli TaxID=562 RepID=UPI00388EF1F7
MIELPELPQPESAGQLPGLTVRVVTKRATACQKPDTSAPRSNGVLAATLSVTLPRPTPSLN